MVRKFSIFRILHWVCGHTGRGLNIKEPQTPEGALRGGFLFLGEDMGFSLLDGTMEILPLLYPCLKIKDGHLADDRLGYLFSDPNFTRWGVMSLQNFSCICTSSRLTLDLEPAAVKFDEPFYFAFNVNSDCFSISVCLTLSRTSYGLMLAPAFLIPIYNSG